MGSEVVFWVVGRLMLSVVTGARKRLGRNAVCFVATAFAAFVLVFCSTADAQSILSGRTRGGAPVATTPTPQPGGGGSPLSPEASQALDRQRSILNRTNEAIQAMRAAQEAARAAAKADPNVNLRDSNGNILNGLGSGALNPAAGLGLTETATQQNGATVTTLTGERTLDADVAKTARPIDPLTGRARAPGSLVWQGVESLKETREADGVAVDITVKDERSILSWDTFNIGKDTTLTYKPTQALEDAGVQGWVALNRIVGGLDGQGRRTSALRPSEILGTLQTANAAGDASRGTGTILILNQNRLIFGPTAQVNVRSLIASTYEIGRGFLRERFAVSRPSGIGSDDFIRTDVLDLAERSREFLTFGLIGESRPFTSEIPDFSAFSPWYDPADEQTRPISAASLPRVLPADPSSIQIATGATLATPGGSLILQASGIENAGFLSAPDGNVALVAAASMQLAALTGQEGSLVPANERNQLRIAAPVAPLRGLVPLSGGPVLGTALGSLTGKGFFGGVNTGLIAAERGGVLLGESRGILLSTTSVSRAGSIFVNEVGANGIVAILPDAGAETIPQDAESLAAFRRSFVQLGGKIGENALVFAPGADVSTVRDRVNLGSTGFIDIIRNEIAGAVELAGGAILDVSGLKDVLLPASRNAVRIGPLTDNDLANSPQYRGDASFLDGATVFIDPRVTGVRSDGVAWVGSPLLDAEATVLQVGAGVAELLTRGGNIVTGAVSMAPSARIDLTGGWTRYQAGTVPVTRVTYNNGFGDDGILDLSAADPLRFNLSGFAGGFEVRNNRLGLTRTFAAPLGLGNNELRAQQGYIEGRDAGTLWIADGISDIADGVVSAADLNNIANLRDRIIRTDLAGQVFAQAFPGLFQKLNAQPGTGAGVFSWDRRLTQQFRGELPAGAALRIGSTRAAGMTGGDTGAAIDLLVGTGAAASNRVLLADRVFTGADGRSQGFSQFSVNILGQLTVSAGATVALAPGGVVDISTQDAFRTASQPPFPSGRPVLIDGRVIAPGGKFIYRGSDGVTIGSAGAISVAGRWVNDAGLFGDALTGRAFADAGSISFDPVPFAFNFDAVGAAITLQLGGDVRVEAGGVLDLTSGGYVDPSGRLLLTAKGGSFRVGESQRLLVDDLAAFRSWGFGGGGTFELATTNFPFERGTTPQEREASRARELFAFINSQGFQNYRLNISNPLNLDLEDPTSNIQFVIDEEAGRFFVNVAFDQIPVRFSGSDPFVLRNRVLPSGVFLSDAEREGLLALGTGGNILSATPLRPTNLAETPDLLARLGLAPDASLAFYRRPVNLEFGTLIETVIDEGARLEGEAGARLGVSALYSRGEIDLPGGTLAQRAELPAFNLGQTVLQNTTVRPGLVAALTGVEDAGIYLAAGSVTDLSGRYLTDPLSAALVGRDVVSLIDGRVVAGGQLTLADGFGYQDALLSNLAGRITAVQARTLTIERALGEKSAALLDLSGASGVRQSIIPTSGIGRGSRMVDSPVWSDAGGITAPRGFDIAEGDIRAFGGDDARRFDPDAAARSIFAGFAIGGSVLDNVLKARGGSLDLGGRLVLRQEPSLFGAPTPYFAATRPTVAQSAAGVANTRDLLPVDLVTRGGFADLTLRGGADLQGDVTLPLPGNLIFTGSDNYTGVTSPDGIPSLERPDQRANLAQSVIPTITGNGTVRLSAAYVQFRDRLETFTGLTQANSVFPEPGRIEPANTPASGSVTIAAGTIDLRGESYFGRSLRSVRLEAANDIRVFAEQLGNTIYFNNTLTLAGARIYPVTPPSGVVRDAARESSRILGFGTGALLRFERFGNVTNTPPTPLSAGGSLIVQAQRIEQNGALYMPHGSLTLGGSTNLSFSGGSVFATTSLSFGAGSITSVSGGDISIPYGATVDLVDWQSPSGFNQLLVAPPAKSLALNAQSVSVADGARIDLSGGGDLFAYEFLPGSTGTRDVLNRLNIDPGTSNDGFLYPDGRQVYAIVPELSEAPIAAFDPVYSADYAELYSGPGAGRRVFLDLGQGEGTRWYTLLPAQYAVLPGGVRVVERTDLDVPPTDQPPFTLQDGTRVATGRLGGKHASRLRHPDAGRVPTLQPHRADGRERLFWRPGGAGRGDRATASARCGADHHRGAVGLHECGRGADRGGGGRARRHRRCHGHEHPRQHDRHGRRGGPADHRGIRAECAQRREPADRRQAHLQRRRDGGDRHDGHDGAARNGCVP
jgi:filamentous hemagglutinin family protein